MREIVVFLAGCLVSLVLWFANNKNKKERVIVVVSVLLITVTLSAVLHFTNKSQDKDVVNTNQGISIISENGNNNTSISEDEIVSEEQNIDMKWNNVDVGGDVNVGNNKITNNYSYHYESESVDELTQANIYMQEGKYDEALSIYQKEDFSKDKAVFINMGYLYGNDLTYYGLDIQKSVDCYIKADCVEGYRNLLALCLKTGETELAESILVQLIDMEDEVTVEYIRACIKGTDYENTEISSSNTVNIISALFQWINYDQWYKGFNPPDDTFSDRWIYQGTDYSSTDSTNHPYVTYRKQIRIFYKYIDMIEKCYYITEDGVEELEIM